MMQDKKTKEKTVLIIDTDKTHSNNISSRLRLSGYNTELCSSGFQALNLVESSVNTGRSYILAIISGDMEDMPGREILLLLRNVLPKDKLPILFFIPDENDTEEIVQIAEEGANDCVLATDNFQKVLSKVQILTSHS